MNIVDCRKCRSDGHMMCQCADDGVLKDGQTVRVGVMMTDSAPGSTAILDYAVANGISNSQAKYEMRLGSAWQDSGYTPPAEDQERRVVAPATMSQADNGQAAYEARLRNAWQDLAA